MSKGKPEKRSEVEEVEEVAKRLTAKHPELKAKDVREVVQREYEKLQEARLRDFIPVLVEHAAKQELKTRKK
ncbi:hypothetical protein HII28_06865 [Planctomonas sp. JC2975]|uniref:three-helix bundle dimerization domain-containing protein n=1 Tax=Planctomonas sp. JC2975 TaxID=2729626 RepID=UPI001472A80B|nr:hypothetical protein [Planctomonas sp. JC2975]NNC11597.1 hypothetical protein [Planctomonas sp. JC2975]